MLRGHLSDARVAHGRIVFRARVRVVDVEQVQD
jgi:hypothetical protein